jgi:hypothetical protein
MINPEVPPETGTVAASRLGYFANAHFYRYSIANIDF